MDNKIIKIVLIVLAAASIIAVASLVIFLKIGEKKVSSSEKPPQSVQSEQKPSKEDDEISIESLSAPSRSEKTPEQIKEEKVLVDSLTAPAPDTASGSSAEDSFGQVDPELMNSISAPAK